MNKGKLYIIPTPIGNLEDITLRAIRILKEVDLVLAEDTRTTKRLFNEYDIPTSLKPFHLHNEHKILRTIIDQLNTGLHISLVSDAGTPGISDPGFLLVRQCLQEKIRVETLPGATAFVPALINSGFPNNNFVFEGFLPLKKGRKSKIEELSKERRTIIIYESPHRLLKTLSQLKAACLEKRKVSVSRELTKIYEETVIGDFDRLIEHFSEHPPKGEFVIVLENIK